MITPQKLITPAQLTAAAATYYTTPVNTKCIITKLTFTNTTGNARTVTLYLVPSGGAAGATNTIRLTKTIAPNDVWEAFEAERHTLLAGDFIQALADVTLTITIMGSGLEIT